MIGAKNSLKNKLALIVLGRSGSGKGTQARFIARRLKKEGVRHLETGRFLRALIKKDNPTAVRGRRLMAKGRLFPSWLAAFTWLKELIEKGYISEHLIYDGAPRRVWEAELIDEVIKWHGRFLPLCIYVAVDVAEATKRLLLRGRKDDLLPKIRNRMKFFEKDVLPVVRYYRKQGRLIKINGNPPPEIVWAMADRAIKKRLGKLWPSR